jgi:peptidylprolyl isomerase
MWISVGSALMTRSLLIWQLTFPKGLGATAGRPRVAPSTLVIFDVQLLYIPGVLDFDE